MNVKSDRRLSTFLELLKIGYKQIGRKEHPQRPRKNPHLIDLKPTKKFVASSSPFVINKIPRNTWEKIYFGDYPYAKCIMVGSENATTAIGLAGNSLGIRVTKGVVLAREKTVSCAIERLTTSCGITGIAGVNHVKRTVETQSIPQIFGDLTSRFLQFYEPKSFGETILLAGFDESGSHLYQMDVARSYEAWKYSSLAQRVLNLKTSLRNRYDENENMTLEEATRAAIRTLIEGFDGELTSNNMEIGIIGDDRVFSSFDLNIKAKVNLFSSQRCFIVRVLADLLKSEMGDSQYSFSLTTFSPSGKLVQIEHALTAVGSGQTSLGIKAANGVVIATEKKLPSILVDEASVQKIQHLTPNIGVVYSGMGPDFRVLVRKSRKQAEQYLRLYKEPIPVTQLVRETATVMQEFTQSGGVRPFGVSLLVAGYDDKGPQLYQVDPSGSYFSWKASAMGKNVSNAKTFLEKRYTEDMELDDAIHTAILTLKEGFEGEISSKNIEIGKIGADKVFRVLTPAEIDDYLAEVE
ncbi:unnamed protein product [Microthlaspi erraticum]|uniref:Proteasome alpha-type subunits domain-containing protein n=4 Tax=Brassicales TaxID=3699 RepID=A0A6D2KQ63_9BRAS|nr:unnamed protein product [Microthlaspi erraticum]